jgi:hypothetical protein
MLVADQHIRVNTILAHARFTWCTRPASMAVRAGSWYVPCAHLRTAHTHGKKIPWWSPAWRPVWIHDAWTPADRTSASSGLNPGFLTRTFDSQSRGLHQPDGVGGCGVAARRQSRRQHNIRLNHCAARRLGNSPRRKHGPSAAAALLHQAANRSACSSTEATSLHQRIHLLASS